MSTGEKVAAVIYLSSLAWVPYVIDLARRVGRR